MELNKKRKRSTHGIQQSKRRLRSSDKITRIGHDCLVHAFDHLELKDLLSAAHVNDQFREAAKYVFIRKYSKNTIKILRSGCRYGGLINDYDIDDNEIILTTSKTILQVLRCFGENISDIVFEYRWYTDDINRFSPFYAKVISYLNRYCADTVKKVTILPFNVEFDKLCSKPFSKAETVKLHMGHLDMLSLNQLFPKMQSLSLEWYNSYANNICERYPHLQNLEITLDQSWCSDAPFFRNIIQMNKQIRCLKVRAPRSVYHQMETIYLPNVEDFTIQDFGSDIPSPRKVPFKFDELKTVTFEYFDGLCINNYYNFFKRHKSIEKLKFVNSLSTVLRDLENGFLSKSKSLKSLTSLKEIVMDDFVHFPIDYVMNYMLDIGTLKSFTFHCSTSDVDIKNCCGDGWEAIQLESPVTLSSILSKCPLIKLIRK